MTREEALNELRSIAGVSDRDAESIEQVPVPRLTRLAYQTAAMLRDEGMSKRVEDAVKRLLEPEVEEVILNQVIGYLKGKAQCARDEAPNAPMVEARSTLNKRATALELAAEALEAEQG